MFPRTILKPFFFYDKTSPSIRHRLCRPCPWLSYARPESSQVYGYYVIYVSPLSGDAYSDRQLTLNFEIWVEIFCVSKCFHMRIPKPCLSVCLSVRPYPEKRNHPTFVNINPTLVIDTSIERSSRVLQHGNPKF